LLIAIKSAHVLKS